MRELTKRELKLIRYALQHLEYDIEAAPQFRYEVAQEIAPETQHTNGPLPDVSEALRNLLNTIEHQLRSK